MKEQFVPVAPDASVVQVLARGVCPICTLMRGLQNAMVENAHNYPAAKLCNFHAWSLAHASPARDAVAVLRTMLEEAPVTPVSGVTELHPCDWCLTIRNHEQEKLREYSRELKRENFRKWVAQYGTICLFHGRRLMDVLPAAEADLVGNMLTSHQDDLEKQLTAFEVRIKRGETGGGGVLGHITEFLVSQRGLTR
ncbi:MAG: hypothetical protein WCC87_25250 [Candidatus Korobacteraceae bacterium]